ncbi:MAG: Lrp/AsnC family transcriptional regulator [Nanoarchaeota archaeon]
MQLLQSQNKDLLFMTFLRQNAREKLTSISKKTSIPVTTLFDKLKLMEQDVIIKHTCLLNFDKLGYHCKANILLKAGREARELLKDLLLKSENVNSLMKINNGFDFLATVIFRDMKELNEYMEELEKKAEILEKQVYFVIEEIVQEKFMTNDLFIA